jgi:hypothetical protein
MSTRKKIAAIASGLMLTLGGCSTAMTTKDYAANTPKLDIRDYLNGPLEASGILFDYSGKADLFFTVKMVGSWQGNVGTLKEDFVYSDGRKDQRTWTITFQDDRTFTATAHDNERCSFFRHRAFCNNNFGNVSHTRNFIHGVEKHIFQNGTKTSSTRATGKCQVGDSP